MGLWNIQPKVRVSWGLDKPKEEVKKPKLIDMAIEKFGGDELLISWLKTFLKEQRQKHLMPTHLSWEMQLATLEKYPAEQRVEQVKRSIQNGYRAVAYEPRGYKKDVIVKDEQQEEDETNYSKAY